MIEPLESRRAPEAGPLVALLLERPPRSLRLLQIGKPGAWEVPPELRAALPRLARDPAVVLGRGDRRDRRAAQAQDRAGRRRALRAAARGGAAIPVDMTALLTGIKAELDKQRPLGVLAALPQVFTADALDQLAAAMGRQWLALGENTARWGFAALGPLGGDHTAALLGEHLERWSHARCVQALEHLRRIGSDAAIAEFAALALRPNGHRPRREVAREHLAALAAARGAAGRRSPARSPVPARAHAARARRAALVARVADRLGPPPLGRGLPALRARAPRAAAARADARVGRVRRRAARPHVPRRRRRARALRRPAVRVRAARRQGPRRRPRAPRRARAARARRPRAPPSPAPRRPCRRSCRSSSGRCSGSPTRSARGCTGRGSPGGGSACPRSSRRSRGATGHVHVQGDGAASRRSARTSRAIAPSPSPGSLARTPRSTRSSCGGATRGRLAQARRLPRRDAQRAARDLEVAHGRPDPSASPPSSSPPSASAAPPSS